MDANLSNIFHQTQHLTQKYGMTLPCDPISNVDNNFIYQHLAIHPLYRL